MTGKIGLLLASILALIAVSAPGMAAAKDHNKDRIPDRWEKKHSLSLAKDQRKLDQDSDGLKNRGEWLSGTNPRDKDSDDDGIKDVKEHAGVISAYDATAGTLTVTLYAGGEISGSVDDSTEVQCEDTSGDGTGDQTVVRSGHGRDSGSDDSSEDDSGDDQSGDNQSGSDQSGGDQSDDDGTADQGHGDHGNCDGNCSIADLAEGVEVTEADVKYTSSGAVFTELDIVKAAADQTTAP